MAFKVLPSHSEEDAGDSIVAEINITPLTDVFLVLLIIFMVTSSVMSQMGVQVNLPTAQKAASETQDPAVIVTLLPGGKLKVNNQDVSGPGGGLEKHLKNAFTKTSSRLVVLEGDRQAFLGSAVEVMDDARKAGAERFAIATSLPKKGS